MLRGSSWKWVLVGESVGAAVPSTSGWGLLHSQQHERSNRPAGHSHGSGGPGAR